MAPYWILFSIPAVMAMLEKHDRLGEKAERQSLLIFSLLLIPFVGLRYEVGGDWLTYISIFEGVAFDRELPTTLEESDPGYGAVNWLAGTMGSDVRAVNVMCAMIFAFGFHRFCTHQPRPWLAAAVAVPYLIIVVAMGYSRQGAAIGLLLAGLVPLMEGNLRKYVLWVLLAATFHRTAVIMIPLAALAETRNRWLAILWVGAAAMAAYFAFLSEDINTLAKNYLESEYNSQGALVRVAQNIVPAIVFLLFRRSFALDLRTQKLWTYLALAALASGPALVLSPSTTAVDRIALYLIPLQLFVYSRMANALFGRTSAQPICNIGILTYCTAVLFVWLNYAAHSIAWVPYRNYLFL